MPSSHPSARPSRVAVLRPLSSRRMSRKSYQLCVLYAVIADLDVSSVAKPSSATSTLVSVNDPSTASNRATAPGLLGKSAAPEPSSVPLTASALSEHCRKCERGEAPVCRPEPGIRIIEKRSPDRSMAAGWVVGRRPLMFLRGEQSSRTW